MAKSKERHLQRIILFQHSYNRLIAGMHFEFQTITSYEFVYTKMGFSIHNFTKI